MSAGDVTAEEMEQAIENARTAVFRDPPWSPNARAFLAILTERDQLNAEVAATPPPARGRAGRSVDGLEFKAVSSAHEIDARASCGSRRRAPAVCLVVPAVGGLGRLVWPAFKPIKRAVFSGSVPVTNEIFDLAHVVLVASDPTPDPMNKEYRIHPQKSRDKMTFLHFLPYPRDPCRKEAPIPGLRLGLEGPRGVGRGEDP